MTEKEFLKGMKMVLERVRESKLSCLMMSRWLSREVRDSYRKELRYSNHFFWIDRFVREQGNLPKSDFDESCILARELHLGLFQQFALDNELYREW